MIPLYPETDVPAAHTTATSRHRCLRLGGALLALAVLLEQVLINGPVARLDHLLEHTLAGTRITPLQTVASWLTWLGNPFFMVRALIGLALVVGFHRRTWRPLFIAVVAVAVLTATVLSLKSAVALPGPSGHLPGDGGSWPSGHTTTAVVVWGLAAKLVSPARTRWRIALSAGVPALVGLTLVYGGYHWLSDVLAGWILGPLLLTLIVALTSGRAPRPTAVDLRLVASR